MRIPGILLCAALTGLLSACEPAPEPVEPPPPPGVEPPNVLNMENALHGAIRGTHRSADNRARDRYRHPLQTLRFFGLKPDMTVVELWPGSGWYTEILAPVLREEGKLIAAHFPADTQSDFYTRMREAYDRKLAAAPAVYDKVAVIPFNPPEQATLAPAGSVDMVLTFRNLHNWQNSGNLEAVFRAAYRALKPGGVFGVVEHRAAPGTSMEAAFPTGYMPEKAVIELARKVGFELAASSEINANPADDHNHPEGVWTLPPTLRLGEMDREKYLSIGESDRMTLKFVKPR